MAGSISDEDQHLRFRDSQGLMQRLFDAPVVMDAKQTLRKILDISREALGRPDADCEEVFYCISGLIDEYEDNLK